MIKCRRQGVGSGNGKESSRSAGMSGNSGASRFRHLARGLALVISMSVLLTSCSASAAAVQTGSTGQNPLQIQEVNAGSNSDANGRTLRPVSAESVSVVIDNVIAAEAQTGKSIEDLKNAVVIHVDSSRALIKGTAADLVKDKPSLSAYLRGESMYVPASFMEDTYNLTLTYSDLFDKLRIKNSAGKTMTLTEEELDAVYADNDIIYYLPLRKVAEWNNLQIFYDDGLVTLSETKDLLDSKQDEALIRQVRKQLTGVQVVGSEEKLRSLISSNDAEYYGGYYNGFGFDDGIMIEWEMDVPLMAVPSEESVAQAAPTTAPAARQADQDVARDTANSGTSAGTGMANDAEVVYTTESKAAADTDEYSTTNIQVQGVDEADVVKTDGEFIYQVNKDRILIISAADPKAMKVVNKLDLDRPDGFSPIEMYVDGDRLIVIGTAYTSLVPTPRVSVKSEVATDSAPAREIISPDYHYYGYESAVTTMLVYDMADKTNLKLIRETEIEGYYTTSRKIDNAVYLIANQSVFSSRYYALPPVTVSADAVKNEETAVAQEKQENLENTAAEDLGISAAYRDSAEAGEGFKPVDYGNMYYFPGAFRPEYMIVAGVDVEDTTRKVSVQTILDSGDNIYASGNYLYIATERYRNSYWSDYSQSTDIHRFSLNNGEVQYIDKGKVNGTVLNQFSMDQYDSYFRIATTSNDENWMSSNNLYVLNGDMKVVGTLEDLAPGEQIYSVRFMGERAYVVTFKTVDPLFVIDLKDPTKPNVLGALKIPGYSDYLHPYDENHIIGFGKNTVEYKNNWGGTESVTAYYQGMKVALFDVTDVTNPKELYKEEIGDRGTESELLYNHKALLFSRERELLAFPVTVMTVPESTKTGSLKSDSLAYGQFEFQGAYVYRLNLEDGFQLRGRITHISADEYKKAGSYWYGSDSNIERLLYIKNALFALSKDCVSAADLNAENIPELGRLKLN